MQHTHISKICSLLLAALLGAALVVPVVAAGQEQELKTLKLVRAYQSEAEFHAANAKMLRAKHPIVEDGEFIKFFDPETGNALKQIKKERMTKEVFASLSATEKTQISGGNSIKKLCTTYLTDPKQGYFSFLKVSDVEINIHRPNEQGVEADWNYIRDEVYNRFGEKIVELPKEVNLIAGSPDGSYFIAYFDNPEEQPGEFIYFYDSSGQLLSKYPYLHSMPVFLYSPASNYVAIYNLLGKDFLVFNRRGEMVLQGDIRTYTGEQSNIEGIAVSDDGRYILLSTSKVIVLLNQQGQKQWELLTQRPFVVRSAYFDLKREHVYLSTIRPDIIYTRQQGILRVVTLRNGDVLDEISHVAYYTVNNERLHMRTTGGEYYEYQSK